jgi:transposase-like protein
MNTTSATEKDKQMAQHCVTCPVCTHARKKQRGFAYWFVKTIENSVCPYCEAYERVYGKKAHEV